MVARIGNIATKRVIKRAQAFDALSSSVSGPVGGWNARDSIADMPEEDAVTLINWVPSHTDLMVRNGFTRHATGLTGQAETLLVYNGPTAAQMFAASSSFIYDVTSAGAVGAADVSGLSNARFQYVNVTTAGGAFLMAVNGVDKLQGYDGTNWYVDGDASHDITGVDTADCIDINLHNNRVWLIEQNSLSAWYLPTNAIAGAAVEFPLGGIARWGGSLIAMGTWTVDAGYGLNDMAVFITNKGEAIVYIGNDPASVATWQKVGQFQIGAPIGNRPFTKFGGDLILVNYDGLTPMAQGLQSSRLDPRVNLTDKIRGAVASATSQYNANYGWQCIDYPKGSLLILNVPVSSGSSQEQYIMNTVTKAWFQCQGFNANCWALYNDDVYFGSNGYVGKAFDGLSDASANIQTSAVQAFSYFGSRGVNKRWTMMRPILQTNGSPMVNASINVDYNVSPPNGSLSFTDPGYALWDDARWDFAEWGGDPVVSQVWTGVNGIGKCAGATMQSATAGIQLRWTATDFVYEKGWYV